MKMIEWSEPWDCSGDCSIELICRMTESDVIKAQRADVERSHGWIYLFDEDALEDFITIHWGQRIDVQGNHGSV